LLALAWAFGVAQAQDDPPGRVGRVAAVQGEAFVFDAEEGQWVDAAVNRPVTQHDRLAVGSDGRLELRIGSTVLYLDASTEVQATRLDDERLQFALLRGSVALRVRAPEVAAETDIVTPEGRFAPLRAGLYRIDRHDEASFASVWQGELRMSARDLVLTLQPGERADLRFDAARGAMRSDRLAPLNDAFAQAVLHSNAAADGGGAYAWVSPEMTGAEELDRWGRWRQHPEFGAVWLPVAVPVGWVPYRHGRWVWLRPWGWTWVDDAPWGFAPFHYGRWLWWGGRWCWTPGLRVLRPVYAPALVGWVGAPVGVVDARRLPSPSWVPLAPREPFHPWYRASPGYAGRVNVHPQYPHQPPNEWRNRRVPDATTTLARHDATSPRGVIPAPGAAPTPRPARPPATAPGATGPFGGPVPGRPPTPAAAPGVGGGGAVAAGSSAGTAAPAPGAALPTPAPGRGPAPMPGARPAPVMPSSVPGSSLPSAGPIAAPPSTVPVAPRQPVRPGSDDGRPAPRVPQAQAPATGPFGGPAPRAEHPAPAATAAPNGAAAAVPVARPPGAAPRPPAASPTADAATGASPSPAPARTAPAPSRGSTAPADTGARVDATATRDGDAAARRRPPEARNAPRER
jgi:hypothetical protein